jgi:site-specific recombinase XerD
MSEENQRTTVDKAIQDFLGFHEMNKDVEGTIMNYQVLLVRFSAWLASVGVVYVDELTLSHLRAWVNHLQKTPTRRKDVLSDSTVRQYASYTHMFCHWLEVEGVIEKPITTRFRLPRVEKKFIPTFTPNDVEKLLDACEVDKRYTPTIRKALTARNRAIVSMLIDTGIRRKELVGLRLCDVDRDLRVLLVHRKGNKWQQVPISYDGFKPLHEYLTKHRSRLAALDGRSVARKDDAVFLADDGKPLKMGGISHLFTRLRERTGIDDKRVSPHQCRRYMATMQLAAGRSPLDVQRQMGHTTLTMTNHYASLNIQHLKRSHDAYSPLRVRQESVNRQGIGTGYWEEV